MMSAYLPERVYNDVARNARDGSLVCSRGNHTKIIPGAVVDTAAGHAVFRIALNDKHAAADALHIR